MTSIRLLGVGLQLMYNSDHPTKWSSVMCSCQMTSRRFCFKLMRSYSSVYEDSVKVCYTTVSSMGLHCRMTSPQRRRRRYAKRTNGLLNEFLTSNVSQIPSQTQFSSPALSFSLPTSISCSVVTCSHELKHRTYNLKHLLLVLCMLMNYESNCSCSCLRHRF